MGISVKLCPRERFELAEFLLVQQKLAGAQGLVVHGVAVGEGSDVGVEQEAFAVLQQAIGVLEVGIAFADRLDLCSAQRHSGLELVGEGVVVAGGAVEGGVALAGGDRVAVLLADGGFGLRARVGMVAARGIRWSGSLVSGLDTDANIRV